MAAAKISPVPNRFPFAHEAEFDPERAREILRAVPAAAGVFALFGHSDTDRPYLSRGADLRRRMARLLELPPPAVPGDGATPAPESRRLNLRNRVARVAWTETGSEFSSLLLLYDASCVLFGAEEARRRLKLRTPYFVRLSAEAEHPRLYVTNRLSRRAWDELYGPFASRMAAERYAEAVGDLFRLRRCHELLLVSPEHPGCIYGEMKRCMAPCNLGCTAEEYGAEARTVRRFLDSRGESLLGEVAAEREAASEAMDFERAADLHARWEKVKATAAEADLLVTALSRLRVVVVQPAPKRDASVSAEQTGDEAAREQEEAAERALLYDFAGGQFCGPEPLSTRGVRAVREQTAVGSSLFAQPLMLAAVPMTAEAPGGVGDLQETGARPGAEASEAATGTAAMLPPEQRLEAALAQLDARRTATGAADPQRVGDHLALLRRWYFRPEKQKTGELFLPQADGGWPLRRILNGAARAALGEPKAMAATDREGARAMKTRLLHAGREGVEREVPVLQPASGEPVAPEAPSASGVAPTFRSRRERGRAR